MKTFFTILLGAGSILLFNPKDLQAQAPAIEWSKIIGGDSDDYLFSTIYTSDGGYLLGGYSASPASGDKSEGSKGKEDYWVVKLDASGNTLWDKTIGGNSVDRLISLTITSDGGYLLGGYSNSPASGNKSENSKGNYDFWIVKLDASGNTLWDKTIGGKSADILHSLTTTSDGGYLLGGVSSSSASGDKTVSSKGIYDYWVVKLDASGNKLWDKTIGGSGSETLKSVATTPDGGYLIGGHSYSPISGDKSEGSKGKNDYWVVKLDASGNTLWDKTIGGTENESISSVTTTSDGGCLLAGYSASPISGDKSEGSKGKDDYWVVKLDASGNTLWDKTIGGNNPDLLQSVVSTSDRGYLLGGHSYSSISGDKTEGNRIVDYWVVKIDGSGNILWDKTVGGRVDFLKSVIGTSDGGYFLGGYSDASISGNFDYWGVKLEKEIDDTPPVLSGIPDDISVECDNVPEPATVTAEDDFDGTVEVTFSETRTDGNIPSSYTLMRTWFATDAAGNSSTGNQILTVTNNVPEINSITAPQDPVQINATFIVSASITESNFSSASWDWGDGSVSVGNMDISEVIGSHSYTTPGVYTVTLSVTDACGESVSLAYQYVVVYDPAGGFVTGGGWIYSPAGSYPVDPAVEGKASFGFVAKYKKGANVPDGNTEFQFKAGSLNFKSTAYEWLVISGHKAMYKGSGTINGISGYGFQLSAVDGELKAGDEPDKIRMKIWDRNEVVVYDNQRGDDDGEATMALGGGSVVIHDGSNKSSSNSRVAFSKEELSEPVETYSFKAYPNPLSEEGLWLEFPVTKKSVNYHAFIYDLRGRALVNQEFKVPENGGKQFWHIDHSIWEYGMYVLIINGNEEVKQLRIMK